jgi:hypothetical protein
VHLQSAGMGLTDRILEMSEDSDLHARTDTVMEEGSDLPVTEAEGAGLGRARRLSRTSCRGQARRTRNRSPVSGKPARTL